MIYIIYIHRQREIHIVKGTKFGAAQGESNGAKEGRGKNDHASNNDSFFKMHGHWAH